MITIFIDANIYLDFFNSNNPQFKSLLKTLNEIKSNIFITQQIVDEVNRNKLNNFSRSAKLYIEQSSMSATILPEHMEDEENQEFLSWNKERKDIERTIKISNAKLEAIIQNMHEKIALSQDKSSIELNKLFSSALKAEAVHLDKAKYRKVVGNPPGKNNDPLGDQITWEILLSAIGKSTILFIVSKDKDFYTFIKSKFFLNPILMQELQIKNPKLKVKVFNKLPEALVEYNKIKPIESLPSKRVLSSIENAHQMIAEMVKKNQEAEKNLRAAFGRLGEMRDEMLTKTLASFFKEKN